MYGTLGASSNRFFSDYQDASTLLYHVLLYMLCVACCCLKLFILAIIFAKSPNVGLKFGMESKKIVDTLEHRMISQGQRWLIALYSM